MYMYYCTVPHCHYHLSDNQGLKAGIYMYVYNDHNDELPVSEIRMHEQKVSADWE
jgi:hypothetical protein